MAESSPSPISANPRNSRFHVRPVSGKGLNYSRGGRVLLDVEEVSFRDGCLTAIVGPNGAGKTLLLRILAGILKPERGQVEWAGRSPRRAGYRKLSLVLQSPVLLRRSALANIVYALDAGGVGRKEAARLATLALEEAGLRHLSDTPAHLLSGGEKQRLALARALAIEPEVLLLDEPVANLDPSSTFAIESMTSNARARGVTVVLVTHDLAQARRLADDVVFMHRGKIVERDKASAFFAKPQTKAATAFIAGEILV